MGPLVIGLIIIVIVSALITILFMKAQKKYLLKQQAILDKLSLHQAEYAINCNFVYGIDQIVENTPCYIYATTEKLIIETNEATPFIANINISQLKVFKQVKRDIITQRLQWLGVPILVNSKSTDKFIIIRYLSKNDEPKEIFFDLKLSKNQIIENIKFSNLSDNSDIFSFVDAFITKQESHIDL